MKLYYSYRYLRDNLNGKGNFGDDLNPWLWPKVFPGVFDDSDASVFVGIGTLLNRNIPKFARTIVFGTGAGFGEPPTIDESWTIYCVRGPLTARQIGVSDSYAVTDPAILIAAYYSGNHHVKRYKVSYMPHAFELHSHEATIRAACVDAGVHCIDPRAGVLDVLEQICESEFLISEAMHGAIAADALRIPWINIRTNAGIPPFKWRDWCESLGIQYIDRQIRRGVRLQKYFSLYKYVDRAILSRALHRLVKSNQQCLSSDSNHSRRLGQLQEICDRARPQLAGLGFRR